MKLPYETATSGDKALTELQRTLAKFGCQSFGIMTDNEKGATIVQFRWNNRIISLEASWKGYVAAMLKNKPYKISYSRCTRSEHEEKAFKQAKISVCSILRDWIKGQVTAVECGIMTFDAAFMPHMLLPSGERVIDRVKANNLLPAPDNKVVELKK
jgi:hypothetical protein